MKKPDQLLRSVSQIFHRKRLKTHHEEKKKSWIKKLLVFLGSLFLIFSIGVTAFVISVLGELPELPTQFNNAESTIIYDRDGNILYTIHGEENRKEIPLNEIPKHVIDATIAIEDDQFFEHFGFDLGGIMKGVLAEYLGIGNPRGGSTITQQLVKNTLLSPERTLIRKIKELILSVQIERIYSKNEILSQYLNTIPYGSNAYGIEMAAYIYFGKKAQNLSLSEAAILASLPQAPSLYNPYGNGKDLLMGHFDEEGNYISGRKDIVLKRMVELGFITEEERQQAFDEASQVNFQKYRENIKYPHFVLYVKELLENKFGKEAVETGGLRVYTTIDPKIQDAAEKIISEKMVDYPQKYGATNASVLSVDIEKGQILAMVGSADYFNEEIDGNVNIVFRNRLPGSSFKPLVYATGFARGYSPASVFYDLETDFGNNYIPQNYDGTFNGPVSARRALGSSLNIPAVKMAFLAGADNIVTQAKKMGLTDLIDGDQYGTSIGLGTGEATMYQMVTAYSVFAKEGKKIAFTPFLRIENSEGKIIESNEDRIPKSKEVLDPQIAYTINHILSDKNARPAGWNSYLQIPNQINAAKTGTSNKRFKEGKTAGAIKPLDNWTIGYTTKVVTAAWVGNNDATALNYNAAGLTTAAPIWKATMIAATENEELEEFPKPEGINWLRVSRRSGMLPSKNTPEEDVIAELFTSFNAPTERDKTFLSLKIDKVSKKLPTEFTPEDSIVEALVTNFHSLNPTDPKWEQPVQRWAQEFMKSYASDAIILSEAPTESDDVHTALAEKEGPRISILSPPEDSTVSIGILEIQVSIDAPHGVEKVEYFLDQRPVATSSTYPYTAKIRVPRQRNNQKTRIGVTVTDLLNYKTSDVLYVTVSNERENDSETPQTSISYPQENTIFPPNTNLTIRTTSVDNISISEVSFYLDDRLMGTTKSSPYELSIHLPEEIAPHTITVIAKDTSNNTKKDTVNIFIEEKEVKKQISTAFIYPKNGSTYTHQQDSIDFFFTIESQKQEKVRSLSVVATNQKNGLRSTLFEKQTPNGSSENVAFTWMPEAPGEYTITINTVDDEEKLMSSSPLTINIE